MSKPETTERLDATQSVKDAATQEAEEVIRFTPEEEAALLKESHSQKAEANKQFASSSYQDAIETYNQALGTCPNYLDFELAVLKSNIAACHLNLKDWKAAVKSATDALDNLDKLDKADDEQSSENVEEEADEEIVSEGAKKVEKVPVQSNRKDDIERIRAKALMRRARARAEAGGWSSLQGAEEDYKTLSEMPNLDVSSRRIVTQQLKALPPRTKAAQEKEMGEMMGKLKQLGNGILSPFGLSTDNFQMVKDENTGGYSLNFNQGS